MARKFEVWTYEEHDGREVEEKRGTFDSPAAAESYVATASKRARNVFNEDGARPWTAPSFHINEA